MVLHLQIFLIKVVSKFLKFGVYSSILSQTWLIVIFGTILDEKIDTYVDTIRALFTSRIDPLNVPYSFVWDPISKLFNLVHAWEWKLKNKNTT